MGVVSMDDHLVQNLQRRDGRQVVYLLVLAPCSRFLQQLLHKYNQ